MPNLTEEDATLTVDGVDDRLPRLNLLLANRCFLYVQENYTADVRIVRLIFIGPSEDYVNCLIYIY
jgi:hypothetical protein